MQGKHYCIKEEGDCCIRIYRQSILNAFRNAPRIISASKVIFTKESLSKEALNLTPYVKGFEGKNFVRLHSKHNIMERAYDRMLGAYKRIESTDTRIKKARGNREFNLEGSEPKLGEVFELEAVFKRDSRSHF